jgi:hypothetical protein
MPGGHKRHARRQSGKPANGDRNQLQPEAINHQSAIDVYNHAPDRHQHRLPADNHDF